MMAVFSVNLDRRKSWWPSIWAAMVLLLSLTLPAMAADTGKAAADYFVHSLPGQPEGPLLKMHAGYVRDRW